MSCTRDKWHNSQYKVMIDFVYDFLKGRFDKHLRDVKERERTKSQPCGHKLWEYLNRLERSYEEWDLGVCGHTPESCRTKWSKYLQTRLHQVERVDPEKFLFLYFKFGIKLSREEANRISQQYRAYDMTWRDGVLKCYLKKVNLRVETRRAEKESEDRKRRERDRNQASANMNEPPSMEEEGNANGEVADEPPVKRTRRGMIMQRIQVKSEVIRAPNAIGRIPTGRMREELNDEEREENREEEEEQPERKPESAFLRKLLHRRVNTTPVSMASDSSREIKEEQPDEEEMTSETEEWRRNRRDRRREMAPTPDERRTGDGGEQPIGGGERREEENASSVTPRREPAAPTEGEPSAPPLVPPSIQPSLNVKKTMVSSETIQAIWDEMTEGNTKKGEKERRKKEPPVASTHLRRRLMDGEVGDTVAAIYEQVPTHSGSPGEFETAESTHARMSPNATAASEKTVNEEVGEAEDEERMEEDRGPLARKLRPRVLGGRLSPAALVARIDGPVQQKRAAAAAAHFVGFKRRSKAGQEALLQAAVDVNEEDAESEAVEQEAKRLKKNAKEMHCTASPIEPLQSTAAVPVNSPVAATSKPVESGALVEQSAVQTSNPIRWDRLRERLLERMKNKRREGAKKKVEKTITLLNSSSRLSSLCESRAAAAALITEDEEMSMAVVSDLLDSEERMDKRISLANDVYHMNMQDDPAVKERLRIKLCGDMASDRLKETMTNALEDDSLWE